MWIWRIANMYNEYTLTNVYILGEEAKKVFNDAQTMLKQIISDNSLTMRGIVGFYPANSVGDDIHVYDENDEMPRPTNPSEVFYGLRQQVHEYILHLNYHFFKTRYILFKKSIHGLMFRYIFDNCMYYT